MTDRVVYLNSELFYYKDGAGSKAILLFHGFGQDHRVFESWNETLQKKYTVYAFDLFFHGSSKWENQQALAKRDWKKIMQLFFDQEKISQFEMAGFSIGAKFVLATFELFPERVQKIILLAPDGISDNFWYSLATGTSMMRSLFRSLILKPVLLQSLLKISKFFYLEDKNLLKFTEFQLSTEEKRYRVYKAWIYFRHFNFRKRDITLSLNSRNIPVVFILGRMDNVIPAEKIKRFAKTLKNHQFKLVNSTHHDLISQGIKGLNETITL
jgi:pimeloyl-ACP methyl ester carboxylesterase